MYRGDKYYTDGIIGNPLSFTIPKIYNSSFRINPFATISNSLTKRKILEEKKAPETLNTLITEKEKIGATLFVVEKDEDTQSWFVRFKTNKFFLTSMIFNLKERVQIQETFGASLVSFFGESIKIYEFSGLAVDWPTTTTIKTAEIQEDFQEFYEESSPENFWQSSLIHLYKNVLRGTQLVQNNRMALLNVGTHYVYGYPLNFVVNYSSQSENLASFSMSWVVLEHTMGHDDVEEDDLKDNYVLDSSNRYNITTINIPSIQYFNEGQ